MQGTIRIKGARENNLKNISLDIPKHKLVVVTGPSGSGKSTLAMDTLQRECQRQYMESMGMVSDSVAKPKVDSIEGLSPSIGVGQHATNRNPRSTIGTVTDVYTLLRIVFSKLGERPCPRCGTTVVSAPDGAGGYGIPDEDEEAGMRLSEPCPRCGHALEKLTMTHFSFNKPEGACEGCSGLGHVASLDLAAVFDEELSVRGGGVRIWYNFIVEYSLSILKAAASHYGFEFDEHAPIKTLGEAQRDLLFYGVESERFSGRFPDVKPPKAVGQGKFEGVVTGIWRKYREKGSEGGGAELFTERTCTECGGEKLKKSSLQVKVNGASIGEISSRAIADALDWTQTLRSGLTPGQSDIAEALLHDMIVRMKRIVDVGLGYMSLNRQVVTLSGGEAQRLRLASILGSGLTGVLYILDEPTAGLHPRDTRGLIRVLKQLRDLGNTVLVIEHDEEVMRAADHIIDIGPGAGSFGGTVVGQGRLEELIADPRSVTGAIFRDEGVQAAPPRRKGSGERLTIRGASLRNLQGITVSLPLGCQISVTGVSGSGKSTLLFDLLAASGRSGGPFPGCAGIDGWEAVPELITVDQTPLSRMQRSNVATYSDVYTHMRNWFAGLPQAKQAKLTAKHFSFNTPGGRCEHCEGLGVVSVHMHFLPELEVRCPACRGRRFKEEVLSVQYEGRTISDILDMTVQESLSFLAGRPKIAETTELLCEVGLGYLKWGQSVRTLSGGEGQRLKLAKELGKKTKQRTLYLLDEPSTGLHPGDVRQLQVLLSKLVEAGHTVVLVEHNMDLVWQSDWVVDIGPEGGAGGGRVVAEGAPEEVAAVEASHTGQFLREKYAVR